MPMGTIADEEDTHSKATTKDKTIRLFGLVVV